MASRPLIIRTWLVPGFAAVLAAAWACSGGNDDGSTVLPDGPELARRAAERMEAVRAFHFVVEHEQGTSPITSGLEMRRAEGDSKAPDRLQADVDALAPQLGGSLIKIRVVSVGGVARMTNPFNRTRWMDVPGRALQELFDPAKGTLAALRAATGYRVTGEATVNGTRCWVVVVDLDAAALEAFAPVAEAGFSVKATLWIGKDDPLVRRIRLEGAMGAKDTVGVVRVVSLTRFDAPVEIEMPSE